MIMDRAVEIMTSRKNQSVLYANRPVWIESVDRDKRTAVIRILDTDQVEEVPISSLTDTGSEM